MKISPTKNPKISVAEIKCYPPSKPPIIEYMAVYKNGGHSMFSRSYRNPNEAVREIEKKLAIIIS